MLQNKRISLDGEWTLHYAENRRVKRELDDEPLSIAKVESYGWQKVAAKVPGNFELDFERAGIIDDPFFACNSIEYQKFENLHLFYSRKFELDEVDENTFIKFEGVDTIADVFVNGQLLGKCDNMLIPFEFSGKKLLVVGENEIVVHITPAVIAARAYPVPMGCKHQTPSFESLFIRKAPHMYGWDIMARAVSGGIWRPCYIEQKLPDRIDDLYVYTHSLKPDYSWAELGFYWNLTVEDDFLTDYKLKIHGECGDSQFNWETARLWHTGHWCVVGFSPKVWWPRNYGEPNLYEITATLLYKGEPVYEYKTHTGVRTIQLDRTSTTDANGDGQFQFIINHKKVFWQGTNWVPVDAYHSRDRERLPEILPMLTDINCNCVRCWGGNVYEDDIFYDFCDRNGIMVWQDFAHGCGVNPQDDEYCKRFEIEVEAIVKRLRNHSSIVLWAGDNEVDSCYSWASTYIKRDPNKNRLTREVIPKVLNAHDYTRPYLPSSPYIDSEAFKQRQTPGSTRTSISEDHLWGPRDYFKGYFYKNSVCHFASETGYHGCTSPESMKRYMRPEQLWHWRKYPDDPNKTRTAKDDWTCHAACAALDGVDGNIYRIKLMSDQVKTLFTNFREDEAGQGLERFAKASQISQAEAKKYFIERFRVTKWRRTGIIWWNLIDGWPQFSDAVVDYYGVKKLAYHYIKRSQQQLCMIFDEPRDGILPLHIASDLQKDVVVKYRVTDFVSGNVVVEAESLAKANESICVYNKPLLENDRRFYFIEWEYELGGKVVTGKNHFVTDIIDLDLDVYLDWMRKAGFDSEFEGF